MKNKIIKKAVEIINRGKIIIFPTATVYGFGCAAEQPKAVKKIYRLKGRTQKKPLVLMLGSKKQLNQLPFKISSRIKKIINSVWPKPVTFIIKAPQKLAQKFNSKNGTLALRLADHPITQKIVKGLKGFLATTSANFSGKSAAADFSEIPEKLLGSVDLVVFGGRCQHQISSTIIDLTAKKPKILRQGAVKNNWLLKKAIPKS